jgi:erythromycin esterase-like protein
LLESLDLILIGEINIGQLVREKFSHLGVYNIGCLGHGGTVQAADEWDTPGIKMAVNPSRPDSVEHVLHGAFEDQNALLIFKRTVRNPDGIFEKQEINKDLNKLLDQVKLERYIGVVYKVTPDCNFF